MAWIFDTYSMNKGHSVLGVVTGKPLDDRRLARPRGGDRARRALLPQDALRSEGTRSTAFVSRFRDSATSAATSRSSLAEEGAHVVAISDSTGGIHNPNGIDVAGRVRAQARRWHARASLKGGDRIDNEELLLLDCDLLAPCALEQVITRGERRPGEGEDHLSRAPTAR